MFLTLTNPPVLSSTRLHPATELGRGFLEPVRSVSPRSKQGKESKEGSNEVFSQGGDAL